MNLPSFSPAVTSARRLGRSALCLSRYCLLCVFGMASPGLSGSMTVASSQPEVKLLELFTSHGCSSCPAADHLLGELLAQDDTLLALEFHVDYWNTLVHGQDGSFTDPFSQASHTQRQRTYDAAQLAGRPGVYTPQAIVNGRIAMVGSDERNLRKALSRRVDSALEITLGAATADARQWQVRVTGSSEQRQRLSGTEVLLVTYLDSAITQVTGGENRHRQLLNHHIVETVTRLGEVSHEGTMQYDIAVPAPDQGCVVMIQERATMAIHAAVECP